MCKLLLTTTIYDQPFKNFQPHDFRPFTIYSEPLSNWRVTRTKITSRLDPLGKWNGKPCEKTGAGKLGERKNERATGWKQARPMTRKAMKNMTKAQRIRSVIYINLRVVPSLLLLQEVDLNTNYVIIRPIFLKEKMFRNFIVWLWNESQELNK